MHGTYAKNLTIASANDIIIDGNITMVPDTDTVLGLIADNFVRVKHQVSRSDWNDMDSCSNVAGGTMQNVTIEAAILALKHSFIVDNYDCGAALGTLTVKGAIAQRFRGVGRHVHADRLPQELQLRRPAPLPQPAVLPRSGLGLLEGHPGQRAGPGLEVAPRPGRA